MQKITRSGSFDAAHRIMNERVKCSNIHGHTFNFELTFSFKEADAIGYALDFKEIKRVACAFIDQYLDHAVILNPLDEDFIALATKISSRHWIMSLSGGEYCNPTAEHISKEIFLCVAQLMDSENLRLEEVKLYETAKCSVTTSAEDITEAERNNFMKIRRGLLDEWKASVGEFEYDDRRI
ncbi:MAG: 6-carboxytetrahydropterin synthase [Bacteroidales bacterium]|nr:6-carboxytetrahydropterin synthase [Bacteroidales bacterium]